jgi:hypothetical protein
MRIIDVVHQLLPAGTDPARFDTPASLENIQEFVTLTAKSPSHLLCPVWPPDLFAVVGTIIDRSGCYTEASPNRNDLANHEGYLNEIRLIVKSWKNLLKVPRKLERLWRELIKDHGDIGLDTIIAYPRALDLLLMLFAIADDASRGMGWSRLSSSEKLSDFAANVLANDDPERTEIKFWLPYWPRSLCVIVSPDRAIVLPKSITTTKGCTIRSLSHNLALLPCDTVLSPEWNLASHEAKGNVDPIRLLMVPFPYSIPPGSFKLTSPRRPLTNNTTHAAFFGLEQRWLTPAGKSRLDGRALARDLILPLIAEAKAETGAIPTGVVLPECSLSADTTEELVHALKGSGIELVITGALENGDDGDRPLNAAYTFVMQGDDILAARAQSKHHRWRVDQEQANSYNLDFDPDKTNHQWWEDIDVSIRDLPFYAIRKDMSIVTLICEDLARMDPAMNTIRSIGPNLVVALLMDGPQLSGRWPGRYAGVLADEPGCAVLTLTCAATVDLSNRHYMKVNRKRKTPPRTVGLWRQADGKALHIDLPDKANGVLLTLKTDPKHQTTLDNRSDESSSRELTFVSQKPLFSGIRP